MFFRLCDCILFSYINIHVHLVFRILTWEDGCFGTIEAQDSIENMFAETSFRGLEETSSCNTYCGTSGGEAVELAVAYMSNFQYALGDG